MEELNVLYQFDNNYAPYAGISILSLFENNKGTVTCRITRPQFYSMQGRKFVDDSFAGSLPAFVAAFTKDRALTPEEAEEIRRIIDQA